MAEDERRLRFLRNWYAAHGANENLFFKLLTRANVGSTGLIQNSTYNLAVAKVKAGEKYTLSENDDAAWVYGFFINNPEVGDRSYNNSRTLQNPKLDQKLTFVAPIDGYICIRMPATENTMMIRKGEV